MTYFDSCELKERIGFQDDHYSAAQVIADEVLNLDGLATTPGQREEIREIIRAGVEGVVKKDPPFPKRG